MRGTTIKAIKKLWPANEVPYVVKVWNGLDDSGKRNLIKARQLMMRQG